MSDRAIILRIVALALSLIIGAAAVTYGAYILHPGAGWIVGGLLFGSIAAAAIIESGGD